jgi:pseudouridine-5'-monophosphatase
MPGKSWPFPIHAVIFDCDGVLLDTLHLYRRAASQLIGRPYTEEFQSTVNGLSDRRVAEEVVRAFNLEISVEEFAKRRAVLIQQLLPEANLVDGVEFLVNRIREMNIPMAVATSANRPSHEAKTVRHQEFFGLFKAVICGDQVVDAKPSPEIFEKAAAALGPFRPENVLVFEDAFNGIKAANAAGMASVMIANPRIDWRAGLEKAGAVPALVVSTFVGFDFDAFEWHGS